MRRTAFMLMRAMPLSRSKNDRSALSSMMPLRFHVPANSLERTATKASAPRAWCGRSDATGRLAPIGVGDEDVEGLRHLAKLFHAEPEVDQRDDLGATAGIDVHD